MVHSCYNFFEEKEDYIAKCINWMVDVQNKRCATKGCITRLSYNFSAEKRGLYCDTHKLDGMISTTTTQINNKKHINVI